MSLQQIATCDLCRKVSAPLGSSGSLVPLGLRVVDVDGASLHKYEHLCLACRGAILAAVDRVVTERSPAGIVAPPSRTDIGRRADTTA